MALDRLTQITSSGISSTSTITVSAIAGVVTATRATVGSGITLSGTQINVGSATTIHSGGFRIGSSDLHSTGITLNNINASGIITSSGGIVVGTGGTIITTTSGGNIGVGTTNPGSNKVEIVGNDGGIGLAINNNVALSFKDSSGIARRAALLSPSSNYYYGDVDNVVSGSNLFLLANNSASFLINGTTRASVSSNGITVGAGGTIITTTASGLVGVGTTNPESLLTISKTNTTYSDSHILLKNSSSTGQSMISYDINGTVRGKVRSDYVGNLSLVANGGDFDFFTGGDAGTGTNRLKIDSSGRVTMPYQPAFMVRGDESTTKASGSKFSFTSSTTGSTKVCFDRLGNWSDANDRFTAPVTGVYNFSFGIYRQSSTTQYSSIAPRVNGSEISLGDTFIFFQSRTPADDTMHVGSFLLNLAAGDYVELFMRGGASTITIYGGHTFFGGYLIG